MNCPSGIKSFYVNAIHYSKSMTIASVPAMWRDEVQAAIDEIDAAEKAALQEKWTSWKRLIRSWKRKPRRRKSQKRLILLLPRRLLLSSLLTLNKIHYIPYGFLDK